LEGDFSGLALIPLLPAFGLFLRINCFFEPLIGALDEYCFLATSSPGVVLFI
jgi:hypothetical protein